MEHEREMMIDHLEMDIEEITSIALACCSGAMARTVREKKTNIEITINTLREEGDPSGLSSPNGESPYGA